MRPVPVAFHIGPLEVHTYGIGLAITFWFAYRYFARRLRAHGYPDGWLGTTFVLVVVASVIGARAVHVLANLGYYESQPSKVLAIWQGGLSSFGGLLFGVPVGFLSARRRCRELRLVVAADLVAPVLAVAWAVGRLLGPQLMVGGGGKPTTAWFGMYYAGEIGKRLPVPIFQAMECLVIYLVALRFERIVARRGGPLGAVVALTAGLWGLSRVSDESVLLPHDNGSLGVEVAGVAFFAVGLVVVTLLWRRVPGSAATIAAPGASKPGAGEGQAAPADPWAAGAIVPDAGSDSKPEKHEPAKRAGEAERATGAAPGRASRLERAHVAPVGGAADTDS